MGKPVTSTVEHKGSELLLWPPTQSVDNGKVEIVKTLSTFDLGQRAINVIKLCHLSYILLNNSDMEGGNVDTLIMKIHVPCYQHYKN